MKKGVGMLAISLAAFLIPSMTAMADQNDFISYNTQTGEVTQISVDAPDDSVSVQTTQGYAGTAAQADEDTAAAEQEKTVPVYVGGRWVKKSGVYYYYDTQGNQVKNTLAKIDGYYYCFGKNGKKFTKTFRMIDGYRYYFQKYGKAAVGWKTINKKKYYFDAEGRAQTGAEEIAGKMYFFGPKGVMQTSPSVSGCYKYYCNKKTGVVTKWTVLCTFDSLVAPAGYSPYIYATEAGKYGGAANIFYSNTTQFIRKGKSVAVSDLQKGDLMELFFEDGVDDFISIYPAKYDRVTKIKVK